MWMSILEAIASATTVALIIIATRWLSGATGDPLPKIVGGSRLYKIKWQWRAVGLGGAPFYAALAFEARHELTSIFGWAVLIFLSALALSGLWLASGSVTTNQDGITRTTLCYSRSLRWNEITGVRLLKKDGEAIELRAGSKKLIVDSRIGAFHHLQKEIEDRTISLNRL